MKRKSIGALATRVGLIVVLAFVSLYVVWAVQPKEAIQNEGARESVRFAATGLHQGSRDFNDLKAEIKRLESGNRDLAQESAKIQAELELLRAQMKELHQKQTSNQPKIKSTTSTASNESDTSAMIGKEDADSNTLLSTDASELTPEEEIEQTDSRMWAQVDAMEEAIMVEEPDPNWSQEAINELDRAYGGEKIAGAHLVSTECRATLCRMELTLNGSKPAEETYRSLVDLVPWEGQGFVQIEDGQQPQVVVYLAREGYFLPQADSGL